MDNIARGERTVSSISFLMNGDILSCTTKRQYLISRLYCCIDVTLLSKIRDECSSGFPYAKEQHNSKNISLCLHLLFKYRYIKDFGLCVYGQNVSSPTNADV